MSATTKARLVRLWREWVRSLAVLVLVITAFRSAIADWNDVPTGSMKPTILEGDRIVVNKLAYDLKVPYAGWRIAQWGDPARGDIVVLFSPGDGKRLVKRVVGLPGDQVAVQDGRLVVNGIPLPYSPLDPGMATGFDLDGELPILAAEELGDARHAVMIAARPPWQGAFAPFTVPDGHYFVMGDNRDQSLDSRHFGPVSRAVIVGRATTVAASLDPGRHFLPRWRRFLMALH
ncbi:MAG TPA: signal peptidase I [Thermoanaerobaculales bacterium]|nr:signal peptidase I [Thermoanaerobaculales bacterium]